MNTTPWESWAWLALGLATAGQAALGWALLHGRGDGRAVRLWSLGAMGMGLGLALGALHSAWPAWWSFIPAWLLCMASPLLRLAALHRPRPAAEAGLTVWGAAPTSSLGSVIDNPESDAASGQAGDRAPALLAGTPGSAAATPSTLTDTATKVSASPSKALAVLLALPMGLALAMPGSVWQAPALLTGWALAHLALAADCVRVRRQRRYRSAALLAVGETAMAAVLLVSAGALLHTGQPGHWLPGQAWAHQPGATAAVLLLVAMAAALANLGGPGFTLDHLRRSRQRMRHQLSKAAVPPRAAADAELWRHAINERQALLAELARAQAQHQQLLQQAEMALQQALAGAHDGLLTARHALDILPPPEAGAVAPGLDQMDRALSDASNTLENLAAQAQWAEAPAQAARTSLPSAAADAAPAPQPEHPPTAHGVHTPAPEPTPPQPPSPSAERCNAAELVQRTLQTLPQSWQHRVLPDLPWADEGTAPPTVAAPARWASLALANLLRNAFEHGHPSAPVRLLLRNTPEGLALSVCDRGPGLAQPGSHTDPNAQPRSPGQGLETTRRLATLHGGGLALTPLPPFGLQATLTLPLADGAPSQQAPKPANPLPADAPTLLAQPLPDHATGLLTDQARALGAPAPMGPGTGLLDGGGPRAAAA